ncbi:hypothetical protein COY05_05230 [Candidatus Peregrinibacteria bacterium CG_4_10_14_0_2_um_filter_38_24]|nr:MAG: hypothetical protein COY05_05230 [Candidatus Peregrinibacteria bacterium CG_4_10_14_0_2_um_filter_38_24]PJC38568.1 MAG: hypothetical protein CO044_04270 [Candidatus Peregrinibacteria bacterium CG_4_9_14_0_2_um_filter_38_9]
MQQYKVPQDVQREDTIIGPLTLKQLGILGIGGGIAYGIYISLAKSYPMAIWLPPMVIIIAITLAFAFLKIHNLDFVTFIMAYTEFNFLPKKRIWIQGSGYPFISPFETPYKEQKKKELTRKMGAKIESLKELSRVLDTHGGIDEAETPPSPEEKNN